MYIRLNVVTLKTERLNILDISAFYPILNSLKDQSSLTDISSNSICRTNVTHEIDLFYCYYYYLGIKVKIN